MTDWTRPGVMTDPGKYAHLLDDLPSDPATLLTIGSRVMVHEFWEQAYGLSLEPPPRVTPNIRPAEGLLAAIVERDDRPLIEERSPQVRIPTNCRGFTVLTVALLRAKGIPARSRCGFGAYFTDGYFEDHWVAEFHDGARWRLADAQLDSVQRAALNVTFDVTDVPHDQFVIAGEAWQKFRAGEADPSKFGLSALGEAGDWWIAANLMRDALALLDVEVLPWDVWDGVPEPGTKIDVGYFDELAAADAAALPELITVPEHVFNVQRDRLETLPTSAA